MKKGLYVLVAILIIMTNIFLLEHRTLYSLMTTNECKIDIFKSQENATEELIAKYMVANKEEAKNKIFEINKNLYACVYKKKDNFFTNLFVAINLFYGIVILILSYKCGEGKSNQKKKEREQVV
jgi:hypothetical protein